MLLVVIDKIQVQPRIIKSGVIDLWIDVAINGQLLIDIEESGLAIDLLALLRTIKEEGEIFVITCRCGNPGCAAITRGINISHDGEFIYWEIGKKSKAKIPGKYLFNYFDYRKNIITGVIEFISLWKQNENAQISPFLLSENRNVLIEIINDYETQ
jgi:hypothetical protein